MELPQVINTTNTTNSTNTTIGTRGGDKKMKIIFGVMIVLSIILTSTAYILAVQQQKQKNPAYLDLITVLKNKLFSPKIDMTGPPGLPGGWDAPMPSTTLTMPPQAP